MDRRVLQRISQFFHRQTNVIIEGMGGHTYQAGTIAGLGGKIADAHQATNRLIADRAGLRPGLRVLDAGCGNGGPAVDFAGKVADLTIEAITISPDQAEVARAHVAANGLDDRITVQVGDYHQLPFSSEWFDVVYFLESACYSPDQRILFQEAMRVLKPGGTLYVKDWFAESGQLDPKEEQALAELNDLYITRVQPIEFTAEAISAAGFVEVRVAEERIFDDALYKQAMVRPSEPKPGAEVDKAAMLTEFGRAHVYPLALQGVTPAYVSELWAVRPPTA